MRRIIGWLGFPIVCVLAVLATVFWASAAVLLTGDVETVTDSFVLSGNRTLTEVVDRVLSFDANGDGRVARHELPERMKGLVVTADLDGDALVTPAEIRNIAAAVDGRPTIPAGDDVRDRRVDLVDVVTDLRLPEPKRTTVMAIVRTIAGSQLLHEQTEAADLRKHLRQVLDREELENLVAAAARRRAGNAQ